MYQKYPWFREFAKYGEWGKFAASIGHPKAKRFSASGGLCSLTLCPWTALGAPPSEPRYRLALYTHHVCPPHIFLTWRCPCFHLIPTTLWVLECMTDKLQGFSGMSIHRGVLFCFSLCMSLSHKDATLKICIMTMMSCGTHEQDNMGKQVWGCYHSFRFFVLLANF